MGPTWTLNACFPLDSLTACSQPSSVGTNARSRCNVGAATAAAPNFTVYALLLIPAGFSTLTVMTSCNAAVQLGTAPEFRGRVMAVYMAIFVGGTPLGAPLIGWVGEVLGPRASILIGPTAVGLTLSGVMAYLVLHKGVRVRLQKGHVEVWYQTRSRPRLEDDGVEPDAGE